MINNIYYVEMYVANILHSTSFYVKNFGFIHIAQKSSNDGNTVSNLLVNGNTKLILTASKLPDSEISKKVHIRGDFVNDISFEVDDLETIYQQMSNNGFNVITPIEQIIAKDNSYKFATLSANGDIQHSLVEKQNCNSSFFLKGFSLIDNIQDRNGSVIKVDHIAIAVDNLERFTELYKRGLGFYNFFSETIKTKHTGMDSVVMNSKNDAVKFVFVTPIPNTRESQIDKFLQYNGGSGVQHIAFLTDNILDVVNDISKNGISFVPAPDAYYDTIDSHLKDYFLHRLENIKDLGVLVDKDDKGYLLQIFTTPLQTRPTFFIEIIQREGAESFGRNNIISLFNAVEKQLSKNLI